MVISLLCVMALGGCATKKKAPEEIISSAVTASVKNFEDKSSLDEIVNMLENGLFTARMEITDYGETQTVSGYYMDKQIVLDIGLSSKLGIDLGKFKEKFPKSVFGTEGDNVASITKEDEQSLIDMFGQIVDINEITDLSDKIAGAIKENSTLKAEYGKKVDLGDGAVKVNVVDMSMTGSQLQAYVDKIAGLFKNLLNTVGDAGSFDLEISEADKDKVLVDGSIYTDVKTDEFLGGKFSAAIDGDEDNKAEFDVNVTRSESTVEYAIKAKADGEQHTAKLLISDLNNVETISVTGDGEQLFELELNRASKAVALRVSGKQVLQFNYDIERAADDSIKSFSVTFNFTDEALDGGMIGSIFALPFLGADPVGMYSGDEPNVDYYIDEDYDYDDYDDYYDDYYDDDYGWYEDYEPTQFKVTLSYAADGTLPEYKDILDFSMDDMDELINELFGMMGWFAI